MNDFSYAQLVRGYCMRASIVCSVRTFLCVFVHRTIHESSHLIIRNMKWSIFAVFSVFLCAGRPSVSICIVPDFMYRTHAGNGLMAREPEHCVADNVRSKGDAFTLNDSHILWIFICHSEFPFCWWWCRVVRVICVFPCGNPCVLSHYVRCGIGGCMVCVWWLWRDALRCTPSLVPPKMRSQHCCCVWRAGRRPQSDHSRHNQLHKYSDYYYFFSFLFGFRFVFVWVLCARHSCSRSPTFAPPTKFMTVRHADDDNSMVMNMIDIPCSLDKLSIAATIHCATISAVGVAVIRNWIKLTVKIKRIRPFCIWYLHY